MTISRKSVLVAAILLVLAGAAYLLFRPDPDTCFYRMGGPGPNSNTPRLDTLIDIPVDQWPAVAQVLQDFANERGWHIDGSTEERWLDMCDDFTTFVRASDLYGGAEGQIGFGIIYMDYDAPGRDGWHQAYRDLHRRLEARWPGRMRYIGGEFMDPMDRPEWLGPEPVRP